MDDRMTSAQPPEEGAWRLLRARLEAGDLGGSNDGGAWTLIFSCVCGESTMRPTIVVFLDLLVAMTVLAFRHWQGFHCLHVWNPSRRGTDQTFAMLAVQIWRDEYGIDPDVWMLS